MTARLELQRGFHVRHFDSDRRKWIVPRKNDMYADGKTYTVGVYYGQRLQGTFTLTGFGDGAGAQLNSINYSVTSQPLNRFGAVIHFE